MKELVRLPNRLNSLPELSKILDNQDVVTDLVLSMCGKKIGGGAFRDVYEFNFNPNKLVIKLERGATECNMSEFLLWNQVQYLCGNLAWVKEWFAPVHYVSSNGRVLIMEKTKQLPDKPRPDKVPKFFHDVKLDNFGWLGNKFVCHDYGIVYGFLSFRKDYQKAVW